MKTLRIGTRRSALALAQSGHVKSALEKAHPGLQVELVGIDTQADEIHQTRFSTEPLQSLDGKNFFVKELDDVLLEKRTDCSIHSYKDLSLDRPQGLVIAAIPPRANPRDIVLFHPDIHKKLAQGEKIIIGSSSPRRAENTPAFLKTALPHCRSEIEMKSLRGNVNTRIKKLQAGDFDGIILAFAGLIRLDAQIAEFPKIILPLDVCPTAPAQGALAVECRDEDTETKKLLSALHHPASAEEIYKERAILKRYGGGCHQAFGATVAGNFIFIHGKSDAGNPLNEIAFDQPTYVGKTISWDGSKHRSEKTETLSLNPNQPVQNTLFVTHHRAVTATLLPQLKGKRIWTSGVVSMQKLAQMGLWVEGCAENLGFASIREMLAEPVLQLPPFKEWTVLTHEDAVKDWENAIATYRIVEPQGLPEGLAEATHIWWVSGSQFLRLKSFAKNVKHHACGVGKTAEVLRTHHITPDIFPQVGLWRKAVQK